MMMLRRQGGGGSLRRTRPGAGTSYAPSSRTSMMAKVERLFSVPAAAAAVEACSARISLDRDVADSRWRDPIVVIFWRRSIGMLT